MTPSQAAGRPVRGLRNLLIPVAAAAFAATAAQAAPTEESEPAATPYRPSVSSPAALPVPGWLDMEFGWQRIRGGDDRRRDSLPVSAKLAFNPDWGIVLGGEMQVRRTDQDRALFTGGGDTTFLVKHRIATEDEGAAWGISAGFKSPTAKDAIGSGKRDAMITGIYSADFAENWHLDANLSATRLGAWDGGESRMQYGWAASVSRSLDDKWGVFVEPSGTRRRGVASTSQFLAGASYNLSKRTVLDFAIAKALNRDAPDWQVMFGVTMLMGRLW